MAAVNIIKILDKYIGSFLCLFLSIFNFKNERKIKRILLIQLWGIGESVLTLPMIRELRKNYSKAEICLLLTERNKEVYFENKDLDKFISLKLNPFSIIGFIFSNFRSYDLVIDMEEYLNISSIISFFSGARRIGYSHSIRSGLYSDKVKYDDKAHCSQAFCDLLKPLSIEFKVKSLEKLNYSSEDKKNVDNLLSGYGLGKNNKLICFVCGAAESGRSRIWPLENFSLLAQKIISKDRNARIIFTGTESEKNLINQVISEIKSKDRIIDLSGKVGIRELFYLLSRMELVVSNDTGPMHIAAAMRVKTIGLFGPNLPLRFGPLNSKSKGIYKGSICKYSPCINVHKGKIPDCYYSGKEYQKCMKNISVDDVFSLV